MLAHLRFVFPSSFEMKSLVREQIIWRVGTVGSSHLRLVTLSSSEQLPRAVVLLFVLVPVSARLSPARRARLWVLKTSLLQVVTSRTGGDLERPLSPEHGEGVSQKLLRLEHTPEGTSHGPPRPGAHRHWNCLYVPLPGAGLGQAYILKT